MLHQPFAQFDEQLVLKEHVLAAAARLFFAASDGAADIAITAAATAPATKNFVVCFIIVKGSPFFDHQISEGDSMIMEISNTFRALWIARAHWLQD